MRIITIGREFGSGGRELGHQLAKRLQVPYYDQEIISAIAKRTALAEKYVQAVIEHRPFQPFPLSVGRSFFLYHDPVLEQNLSIYREQSLIIEELAAKSDCVIVGRCADYILREKNPFRIFVYADEASKLKRCRARDPEPDKLSDKELKRKIAAVDRNRAAYYDFYTGQKWGDKVNYDLCINLSAVPVALVADAVIGFLKSEGK